MPIKSVLRRYYIKSMFVIGPLVGLIVVIVVYVLTAKVSLSSTR